MTQHACPMWVPLVENGEHKGPGADYFIQQDIDALLSADPRIDTILLGCTHFPMLIDKIRAYVPDSIKIVSQDTIVAKSLKEYLERHPTLADRCTQSGAHRFYTTESIENFESHGCDFLGFPFKAEIIDLLS